MNHLNKAIEINGIVHEERYELPERALRELIVNAAIHRNYQMSSSIQVAVFDDRVEISSPGSLYGTLTLEEAMSGRSSLRNRTLARVLEKVGIVEGWGSGLKRICSDCLSYNIPFPVFIELGDMLRVNFYRPSYIQIGDKSATKPTIGDKSATTTNGKILDYLEAHPASKSSETAQFLGLKISRTKDYLSELSRDGKIVSNGANRNRTYSLK